MRLPPCSFWIVLDPWLYAGTWSTAKGMSLFKQWVKQAQVEEVWPKGAYLGRGFVACAPHSVNCMFAQLVSQDKTRI